MDATTLVFGNFKGGVGKTTNSTMTALELARRGNKTLVVDLDPQGNATNLFLKTKQNVEKEMVVFDKTLMAAIRDKQLNEALVSITENLDILASAPDFSLYPRYMESISDHYNERVVYLNKLLQPLRKIYDYIIIDIPPTISLITDSALYASDFCVIILQTQERSLQGAEAFVEYIQKEVIDKFKAPRLDVLGVLPVLLKMVRLLILIHSTQLNGFLVKKTCFLLPLKIWNDLNDMTFQVLRLMISLIKKFREFTNR